jgi:hypothetical protein
MISQFSAFARKLLSICCLLALLTLAAAAQAPSSTTAPAKRAKPAAAQKKHPKLAPGKDCADCHKKQVDQWQAGPHGANAVKCLVCHGDVQEDFIAKPPVARCQGCHDRQFVQLTSDPFMKGKSCFTCHPAHSLQPHKASGKEKQS